MTIHHDKLAYGKLAASREDLSDERIFEMLGELEEYADETEGDDVAEKKGKEDKDDENAL